MKKIELPFVRNPYNYDRAAVSDETALVCRDVSLTQQSDAEDADINVIMERFGVTGQLPKAVRMPVYGDFTGISDFRSAIEASERARDSFMQMPAQVRNRFGNDPAAFVAFCADPANQKEAGELGLLRPDVYDRVLAEEKKAEAERQAVFQRGVEDAIARSRAGQAVEVPPEGGKGAE